MPAVNRAQSVAAIAEHQPGKLFARNKGMLGMSQNQLSDFASKPLSNAIQAKKVKNQ